MRWNRTHHGGKPFLFNRASEVECERGQLPHLRGENLAMKKQSDFHTPSRVRESETPTNNFPAPAFTESRPKGITDRNHPGHISRGAAESNTDPVKDKPEVSGSMKKR
jgi:hypothetical protein